jgi:hypothetical protein
VSVAEVKMAGGWYVFSAGHTAQRARPEGKA